MHASRSSCLSAQQPVVRVGVPYQAASSGYPMGVPPSQNLHAGPLPRVNGKIGAQEFTSTPQIPPKPYMDESNAGARVEFHGNPSYKSFQVPQITQPPPVQVEGQSTMERLSCPPSIPGSVVFSEGWVAQQMGNSGDKLS
ncbi:hypothetical protein AMTR_s00026p00131540 [Amborella trichopoda]|uniref:Uncharacterized protein n=1 Tax=Amborella trichopoda TaxID=13333 RepID=W1PSY7_AMBTC|nr:hypothetical protein AMTR_s00026p00131540 [Amborella trichopoda]